MEKQNNLGYVDAEIEAAVIYNATTIEFVGECAKLYTTEGYINVSEHDSEEESVAIS